MFPNMPQFPEFSFTRAMAVLWKTIVYEKLENELLEAYLKMLETQRVKVLENLHTKSENYKTTCKFLKANIETIPMVSESNESLEIRILESFSHNIADISINELKIHTLGHSSKFVPDFPYQKFDEKLILQTKYFF